MSLAVSWLLCPLALGLLSLGVGLLLERASGAGLQRELLLPLGFAGIVVVSLCTTASSSTARLTTPLVVALAVAGLGLALPWRARRRGGWAAACAAAAYAAFGAPVVLSGNATFAGYIKLDDTSTWLALADRLLDHGRNSAGLAPSTYEATVAVSLAGGYPVGAFAPLGMVHEIVRTDSAWLFQPYVAFLAAMLALGVYGVLGRVVEPRPLRAIAAFVAAQPALLYAYSLWGGVKEMAAAAMLVLVAALTPAALQAGARPRSLLPLAAATSALLGVESFFGAVWIVPILVPALVAGLWLCRAAFLLRTVAFAVFAAVLSIPTLILTGEFSNSRGTLTTSSELGNLLHPLSVLQVAGIWPVGDFRHQPPGIALTYVLVAVAGLAALAGLCWAWKRGEWGLVLYIAGAAVGCAVTVGVGSPWFDGRALAIASPAVLVAGMAAVGWLFRGGRRTEAIVALLVIGGGVVWSNALAYHEVSLAPRGQLRELETVGHRFAGDGPALMNEYAPYGVRHFLRKLDPEGASELRRRPILLRDGTEVPKGEYADIDRFQLAAVLVYRTLVLVRTPTASRPPSLYKLVWSGRYYDVWQRPAVVPPGRLVEHVPLGNDLQPATAAPCADVLRLAQEARTSAGHLVAATRPPVTVGDLGSAAIPPSWQAGVDGSGAVFPARSGTLESSITIPADGRYGFWVAGSFRRDLSLSVDGRHLATAEDHLNHPGVDTPFGEAELTAGAHRIALAYAGSSIAPGSGGPPLAFGPLLVSRLPGEGPLIAVQPAAARSWCGKRLDWIEVVAG
jgi:hypothetical protein